MDIDKILQDMTLEEKAGMCSGLDFWRLKGVPRLGVPSIMVTDGPHGLRKQDAAADHLGLGKSVVSICFPTASALASSFDRELLHEVGTTLGKECQAEDVAVLLGPGANIKRSPICGRNFEYFSEDPYLSTEMATAHISGLQEQGIGCSIKHYLANNQETGRMYSDSVVDERTLREIYLASFEGAVKNAHPKTVMCAYNKINGLFAAEHEEMLTEILREQWGFDGFVVTDWGAIKERVSCLKAGLDLEMPGGNKNSDREIVAAVEDGTLDIEILNKAVKRILKVIQFYVENRKADTIFEYEAHHKIAVKAAEECGVLLKNNGILPFNKNLTIAFIGEFAENPRYQGSGSSFINSFQVESAIEAAKGKYNIKYAKGFDSHSDEVSQELLEEAKAVAKNADAAVIFAGLPNSYESEGFDRKHMKMPQNQNKLIDEISAVQSNVVVVLHNGSPVEMPWVQQVPGILEMYLGGEGVGAATVNLLFGEAVPSGKLAETFPILLEHNPSHLNFPGCDAKVEYREGVYVGYRYYDTKKMDVLFPFGHGLSYTTFEYSNLKADKESILDTDTVTVTAVVKNTGTISAKEIVQLYVKPLDGKVLRPEHELKGFVKINLAPGEEKQVSFTLDKRAFAYYNTTIKDWHVESGKFEIQICASSRDIRLTEVIEVQSTVEIPVVFTAYSSIGMILQSPKGAMVLGSIPQTMQQQFSSINMGEGSEEMVQAIIMETPLVSLISFGAISKEELNELLTKLNQ